MENTVSLDTDILIDILRNDPETIEWFKKNIDNYSFSTSVINLFELYTGAYKSVDADKKIKDIEELSQKLIIIDLKHKDSHLAGKIKALLEEKGMILETRDILIGSIALSNNLHLKTNNKKHFSRIEGLKLV